MLYHPLRCLRIRSFNLLFGIAANVPILGFAVSGITAACGKTELAEDQAKRCGKSTIVCTVGAVSAITTVLTGGAAAPVGAAATVAAGVAADALITGIESIAKKKYCPNGVLSSA